MIIYALQFNNYFNKRIKKYTTVEDYISHSSNSDALSNGEDINFIPNDDVTTELVIDWDKEWNPDYLILVNKNNEIDSRWFIKEKTRLCAGQMNLVLKRDTVADKLNIILNSPCFVEKGFVSDENPLIFNKEDFDCNQIKKQECLLKDTSNISWLVIYYNKSKKSSLNGSFSITQAEYIDTGATSLEEWTFWQEFNGGYNIPYSKMFSILVDSAGTTDETCVRFNSDVYPESSFKTQSDTELEFNKGFEETAAAIKENIAGSRTLIKYYLDLAKEPSMSFDDLMSYDGKIYKCGSKFYKIVVSSNGSNNTFEYLDSGDLFNAISNAFKIGGVFKTGWSGNFNEAIELQVGYTSYSVQFVEMTDIAETYSFDFRSVRDIKDAPYGIICLPYKVDPVRPLVCEEGDYRLSVLLADKLCESGIGPDKAIYDVQVLPYCPFNLGSVIRATGEVSINYLTDLQVNDYVWIKNSQNANKLIALIPEYATFSKNVYVWSKVNITAQMYFLNDGRGNKDVKAESNCVFYRFVSPNYNGQFEFNRAKNGDFESIEIDCCYKPYQPYIHVAPNFKDLYGEDFNDARGLICGGDFSFSVVTSAWESYKLQNKNYQEIFNRLIESMDTKYEIEQKYRGINAIIGGVGGGIAGGIGAVLGHPAAAVGGAMASGGAIINGITGPLQAKEKHAEERDYAIDIHNYQLGNIRALPNTLAKVDAFNGNFKLFPFIERYSCTDEEIEIFRNKIKYEGMTINALGNIVDYINPSTEETFIKGKMIRLEGLNEEDHFARDIYNEVATGLYIVRGE